MMPTTSLISWWSVVLGGFSTPVTTAQAGADTAEGWAAFARTLAGESTAAFDTGTFGPMASAQPATMPGIGHRPAAELDDDETTPSVNWLGGLGSTRVVVDTAGPAQVPATGEGTTPIPVEPGSGQDPAQVGPVPVSEASDEAVHVDTPRPIPSVGVSGHESTDSRALEPSNRVDTVAPAMGAAPGAASQSTPATSPSALHAAAAPATVEAPVEPVQPVAVGASPAPAAEPGAQTVDATGSSRPAHQIEREMREKYPVANPIVRPAAGSARPTATVEPRTLSRPEVGIARDAAAEIDGEDALDLLEMADEPTPVTARETAASVPTAATTVAMGEALSRVRLSVDRVDRTVSRERAATMERATEFGARLSVRPALVSSTATPTDETVTATPATEVAAPEDFSAGTGSPMVTTTSTPAAPSNSGGESGRERTTGLGETTPTTEVRPATGADAVRTPGSSFDARTVADLGARLRAAIVETMEQQARDELLNSTREAWTATVTVEPASLGRVDLQVTRGTGGLEVILVAAHQEAARALDAEMDDMVEELVRRDLEPAKVTVRSGDGHMESDRQPNRSQQQEEARGRRQDADATSDEKNEREGRRGSTRDPRERQAMAR